MCLEPSQQWESQSKAGRSVPESIAFLTIDTGQLSSSPSYHDFPTTVMSHKTPSFHQLSWYFVLGRGGVTNSGQSERAVGNCTYRIYLLPNKDPVGEKSERNTLANNLLDWHMCKVYL